MVIRKVGVASAAKILGLLEAVVGLLAGLVFAMVSMVAGMAGPQNEDIPRWLGPFFGVGGLILFPILYGIIGVVVGAVGALLYNGLASVVGGLEIDVS